MRSQGSPTLGLTRRSLSEADRDRRAAGRRAATGIPKSKPQSRLKLECDTCRSHSIRFVRGSSFRPMSDSACASLPHPFTPLIGRARDIESVISLLRYWLARWSLSWTGRRRQNPDRDCCCREARGPLRTGRGLCRSRTDHRTSPGGARSGPRVGLASRSDSRRPAHRDVFRPLRQVLAAPACPQLLSDRHGIDD